jgi:hypothetical protein
MNREMIYSILLCRTHVTLVNNMAAIAEIDEVKVPFLHVNQLIAKRLLIVKKISLM